MILHPINLIVRFLLEIAALIFFGIWGWEQSDNWLRFVLAIGIPIVLAAIWGIFAVPNDPSRSGSAPVKTNGFIRLVFELSFFAFAIWTLKDMGSSKLSLIMAVAVLVHYVISYKRVIWLLTKK